MGDVRGGGIWRLDTKTRDFELVIQTNLTEAVSAPAFGLAGVDGVHVRDGVLYFTNIGESNFYSVPINLDTGRPSGPATTISHTLQSIDQYDDFTFDDEGNAFLVTGAGNSIEFISANRRVQEIVAGNVNSTEIAEPTSAAFGRHPADRNVLYVTTAGGLATPVDGDIIVGGQLIAVSTPFKGVTNPLTAA